MDANEVYIYIVESNSLFIHFGVGCDITVTTPFIHLGVGVDAIIVPALFSEVAKHVTSKLRQRVGIQTFTISVT